MPTLLLRLTGPMQAWGTTSRFDQRDSGREPSKSGVIGILAAAMGIDRENWIDLEPLTKWVMGTRHERPGFPRRDYQTAKEIISADRSKIHETAVTVREYLSDAYFLVGLEGEDLKLLLKAHESLANPCWSLGLGRKSYVPSEPIQMEGGVVEQDLRRALTSWPWMGRGNPPPQLMFSWESRDSSGQLRMDQPLSSFAERKFGVRHVVTEWLPLALAVGGDNETV